MNHKNKIPLPKISSTTNAALSLLLGAFFFLIPFGILITTLLDPGLRTGEVPRFTYRWHRQLSPKFEAWAQSRTGSDRPAELSLNDISGTEWPIFSAVYYLWATEELQTAWEQNPALSKTAPTEYAAGAIEAAAALIADPNQAAWVIRYWGNDYLERENVFYRMLYMNGLTSYQNLTGDTRYQELLLTQVDSFAAEIDASPHGLLDDYPDQCYPIDILPALTAIHRADIVLGTDHSAVLERAIRGFEGDRLDPLTQLPPFFSDAQTGEPLLPSRGVGNAYMLIWAPEIWPETAETWYTRYEDHFWKGNPLAAGFWEFSQYGDYPRWHFMNVDAGPVMAGYGTTASAFGIAAARVNGRMSQAYPMSAEALLLAWQLPDGTLLGARALSNLSDAPYLGETALLFIFTRTPIAENPTPARLTNLPAVVILGFVVGLQGWFSSLFIAGHHLRKARSTKPIKYPTVQFALWAALVLAGTALIFTGRILLTSLLFSIALLLPRPATHPTLAP